MQRGISALGEEFLLLCEDIVAGGDLPLLCGGAICTCYSSLRRSKAWLLYQTNPTRPNQLTGQGKGALEGRPSIPRNQAARLVLLLLRDLLLDCVQYSALIPKTTRTAAKMVGAVSHVRHIGARHWVQYVAGSVLAE
jgi:hypothetical protein